MWTRKSSIDSSKDSWPDLQVNPWTLTGACNRLSSWTWLVKIQVLLVVMVGDVLKCGGGLRRPGVFSWNYGMIGARAMNFRTLGNIVVWLCFRRMICNMDQSRSLQWGRFAFSPWFANLFPRWWLRKLRIGFWDWCLLTFTALFVGVALKLLLPFWTKLLSTTACYAVWTWRKHLTICTLLWQ